MDGATLKMSTSVPSVAPAHLCLHLTHHRVAQVLPPGGVSLRAHADILLAHELPMGTFEESLMCFIEGLLDAHPKPLYAQLELGKVDGLSRPEPS